MLRAKAKRRKSKVEARGVTVVDYERVLNLEFEKMIISRYKGTFKCEGKYLHNREFIKECHIRKMWLTANQTKEVCFYLNEELPMVFKTLENLVDHFNSKIKL